jgi:hypothetical protein
MDNSITPGEAGGVFAGLVALLALLGQGAKWLLNWKDVRENTRAARLRAWEQSLDKREKDQREEAVERERKYHDKTDKRLVAMENKAALMFALNLQLVAELERLDAGSPVLVRVRLAIKEALKIDPELPDWFRTMVQQVENK